MSATSAARPDVSGYERGCGADRGCVFGPSWTDDHAGIDGHDGCDTRNDVLRRQLDGVTFRPGTHDCVVINASKGDRSPGEWMPINRAFRCEYIDRFLDVALAYDLPVTRADVRSMRFTLATC